MAQSHEEQVPDRKHDDGLGDMGERELEGVLQPHHEESRSQQKVEGHPNSSQGGDEERFEASRMGQSEAEPMNLESLLELKPRAIPLVSWNA